MGASHGCVRPASSGCSGLFMKGPMLCMQCRLWLERVATKPSDAVALGRLPSCLRNVSSTCGRVGHQWAALERTWYATPPPPCCLPSCGRQVSIAELISCPLPRCSGYAKLLVLTSVASGVWLVGVASLASSSSAIRLGPTSVGNLVRSSRSGWFVAARVQSHLASYGVACSNQRAPGMLLGPIGAVVPPRRARRLPLARWPARRPQRWRRWRAI